MNPLYRDRAKILQPVDKLAAIVTKWRKRKKKKPARQKQVVLRRKGYVLCPRCRNRLMRMDRSGRRLWCYPCRKKWVRGLRKD